MSSFKFLLRWFSRKYSTRSSVSILEILWAPNINKPTVFLEICTRNHRLLGGILIRPLNISACTHPSIQDNLLRIAVRSIHASFPKKSQFVGSELTAGEISPRPLFDSIRRKGRGRDSQQNYFVYIFAFLMLPTQINNPKTSYVLMTRWSTPQICILNILIGTNENIEGSDQTFTKYSALRSTRDCCGVCPVLCTWSLVTDCCVPEPSHGTLWQLVFSTNENR